LGLKKWGSKREELGCVMPDDSGRRRVGYGNPPEGTRFKPGRSGNPKGRPKRVPTFAEDIQDELNRPHRLNANETVTRQRAIIIALIAQAIDGDTRAVGALMRFMPKDEAREQEPQQRDLSAAQQALLRELVVDEIASQRTEEADADEKIKEDDQQSDQENGHDDAEQAND
jgi:hypothetical protein